MAITDAYTIPITQSVNANGPHSATPAGSIGNNQRIKL